LCGKVDWINVPSFEIWKQPSMSQCKNVFEAILRYGHDEDFVPQEDDKFVPTDAPAGSSDKIEVLRRRVELGQPLWHSTDRVDYSGLTGAIRPRE
jgi:hypothetical protein